MACWRFRGREAARRMKTGGKAFTAQIAKNSPEAQKFSLCQESAVQTSLARLLRISTLKPQSTHPRLAWQEQKNYTITHHDEGSRSDSKSVR